MEKELRLFLHRLLDRGYRLSKLTPLFDRAITNAKRYLSRSDEYHARSKEEKKKEARRNVYYHLPFHPQNPPSSEIQRQWRRHVWSPPQSCWRFDQLAPISRMIVCYHRPPNLGNLLSYRKLCKRKGLKVSSYLARRGQN